jgi:hypothetical protein
VVTQRIANPLSPIENIRFFLAKTALGGRNGARTCKTLCTGAAALALAGCGAPTVAPCPSIAPPVDVAPELAGGPQFRSRCIVLTGGGSWECYPGEMRAILDICGLGGNPGCEAEARAAVDAISLERARSSGAAALLDIHDAAVASRQAND